MKSVTCKLSPELNSIEIHTFADLHIGDPRCDIKHIKSRLKYVEETPNAFILINGDVINNATKTSVSDCYGEVLPPMEQIQTCLELFESVKDKIIAVTSGNHENRTYIKEGIDIMDIVCAQFEISDRYSREGAYIYLSFGKSSQGGLTAQDKHSKSLRQNMITIYCTHGSGGGRKEGAKAIRLADMASIVDADIYVHSHTHLPMIMKQGFYRPCRSTKSINFVNKLFVNTSSSLDYGGYGQQYEMKPSSKDCPVIYLQVSRSKHTINGVDMTAKL